MADSSLPKPEDFLRLPENDFEYLNSVRKLKKKIIKMADILQLTDEDISERRMIVEDITNFLLPFYPNCVIMVYGSSQNGFGFKDCDLDLLFLPFPEYCNLDFKDKGNCVIPTLRKVLNGSYPREELRFLEEECHLKFVQRIMYSKKYYFRKIQYIPAKCPILNITFVKSPISCDFSASNRLVVNNTELLWLFGTLDRRVRPLVMVLRYWAKSLGFIKKSLLSSYSFTLMVIFYLQNTVPPVLPSVRSLIEIAGYSREIDGWETAICMDHNCIFRTENSTSVDQLLVQFFEFYWNFDFIQNIVSTYYGRPLPVVELKGSHDERVRSFQVTAFSIQDPFVLSRNVGRNAAMKTSFKLALLIARELVCQANFPFQLLFDSCFYEKEMTAMLTITKNYFSNSISCTHQLTYDICCKLGITSHLDPWYMKVSQVVLDVLQYGLLIECEVVDKVIWDEEILRSSVKRRKIDADNVEQLDLIMSVQCTVNFNTLQSRKKVLETDLEMDDTELPGPLRKQFSISKQLIKKEASESAYFFIMCHCYKYPTVQIPDIVTTFSPLNNDTMFNAVKGFLVSFVRNYVKKILEED